MKLENETDQTKSSDELLLDDFYDEVFKELLESGEVEKIGGFYHFHMGRGFDK